MSTYFTDFEEYSTGALPSDWTVRINANDTWTVETDGSDKFLQLSDPDSAQYLSWDDIDADAERQDSEVLLLVYRSSGTSALKFGAVARLSGSSSAFSGYRCAGTSTNFQIYKANSATSWTSLASQSFTHTVAALYWVRFQVSGTTIRARMWLDGTSEPTVWTGSSGADWAAVTATDSDVSGDGWVGCYQSMANLNVHRVFKFGVGTNGDTAPSSAEASYIRPQIYVSRAAVTRASRW